MANVGVHPYKQIWPPKAGCIVTIEFDHLECQTIKNAPGLPVILGVLAAYSFGPLGGSLVAGFVYAAREEIGAKDIGNGVNFAIDQRVLPTPSTTTRVDSR